jgi:hypothetical protein
MSRGSVLQQINMDQIQKPSIDEQRDRKKDEYCRGKYCFYWICMLAGILVGSIPLAAIVTMYVQPQHYTTSNISMMNTKDRLMIRS